jgi:uncharacterized caspase-like protein
MTSPKGTCYALGIGINNYHNIRVLSKATNDAAAIVNTLIEAGYPQANTKLLLDDQATREAILDQLYDLARVTDDDDTVVIYFAGHGLRHESGSDCSDYLCPVEAHTDRPATTCITGEELTSALRATRAVRLVVFLDACHAGGIGETRSTNAQLRTGLSPKTFSQLAGEGRVIVAACRPEQQARELPEMQNGLFTYYVLEGLRGAAAGSDGLVKILSLFGYVSELVSKRVSDQNPFIKATSENFAIARRLLPPGGALPLQIQLPAPGKWGLEQLIQLRKVMRGTYDRSAFEIFCRDMGVGYHDLPGEILEAKMMYLIDKFWHRDLTDRLADRMRADNPHLLVVPCVA